jgi:hypothetical protein
VPAHEALDAADDGLRAAEKDDDNAPSAAADQAPVYMAALATLLLMEDQLEGSKARVRDLEAQVAERARDDAEGWRVADAVKTQLEGVRARSQALQSTVDLLQAQLSLYATGQLRAGQLGRSFGEEYTILRGDHACSVLDELSTARLSHRPDDPGSGAELSTATFNSDGEHAPRGSEERVVEGDEGWEDTCDANLDSDMMDVWV